MYRPYADSTLMGMTKKRLIEQLRIAEYNHRAAEESVTNQMKLLMELAANVKGVKEYLKGKR